jgi:glucose-6-phosphate dehydrogenase assembly protein OpcA
MSNFSKKVFVLALVGVASLSTCGISYAANEENSFTGFFRRLFNYPVKATEKTGEMTANTLHNTGSKVLSQAGENTANVLQGDLAKSGNLAADAVTGTLETAGQTTSETVQIPVKSAEESQQ